MIIFKSKKFWAAVAGVVAVALSHFFNIAESTTLEVSGIVIAYILGQGIADIGKAVKSGQ